MRRIEVVVPLVNVGAGFSHARMAPDWELGIFTPAEKNHYLGSFNAFAMVPEALRNVSFRLKAIFNRDPSNVDINADNDVGTMLTALRLYKEGDVGAPCYFEAEVVPGIRKQFVDSMTIGDEHTARSTRGGMPARSLIRMYRLEKRETREVARLARTLQSAANHRHLDALSIAIRRLHQSYQRDRGEDRIIDLTVALESSL
jgi:hypothetical protein